MANKGLFQIGNYRVGHYGLLLAVGCALFLVNLGGPSLWDADEGRNAEAAASMMQSGDYVVPRFNGQLRVDKPALLYWLQGASYRLFGLNEGSARLPSALAALLTLLLCYELGRYCFSPASGLLAGLVVASSPMFCVGARFANPDALLNLFTVLTLVFFWRGYAPQTRLLGFTKQRPGWFWFVSMGLSSGLAVLAKGPVGLVLPMTVVGLFLLWNRQLGLLWKRRLFLGVLAFSLVALPWYIAVGIETRGAFLKDFLLHHNLDRFNSALENHYGSVVYYPFVFLLGFAPWSWFIGLAAWYGGWSAVLRPWNRCRSFWENAADREVRTEVRDQRLEVGGQESGVRDQVPKAKSGEGMEGPYRFLACWIAVYLVFFSLAATKLPNYILPIYVPAALLTGRFLDRWRRGLIHPPKWLFYLVLCGIIMVGLAVGFGLMLAGGKVKFAFMNDHYVEGLDQWWAMGLVLIGGALLAWPFLRRNQPAGVIVCLTTAIVLFLGPLAAWGSASLNRHKAPRSLVKRAGACQTHREIRIGAWQMEYLPSLNFYVRRDVIHHQTEQQAADFLRYPIPVFLFVPEPNWQDLQKKVQAPHRVVGRHHDLYHACDVVVVTNQ